MDNGEQSKSFKIAPTIEMINERFLKFSGFFSRNLNIHEQLIQYYGRHFLKQFIGGKPKRFGYKNWAICCSSKENCFHFDLYGGKQEQPSPLAAAITSSERQLL